MKKQHQELLAVIIIAAAVIAGFYGWHSPFCYKC